MTPSALPPSTHVVAEVARRLDSPHHRELLASTFGQAPPEMAEWLGRAMQLQGVPFDALVAHPDLLPNESVRFFFVDRNWTHALHDGALSIGTHSSKSTEFHDTVRATVLSAARRATLAHRAARRGVAAPAEQDVPWTGMLLRSALVSDWPGLQVHAYANTDRTGLLAMLRMDRLAPTVLLCLFQGVPKLVCIEEPMEGIAFGVPDDEEPGEGKLKFDDARVLQWDATKAALTPAEFALQLMKKPARQSFKDKEGAP